MNSIVGVFMPWWGPAPGWQLKFLARASASRRLQVILVGDAASWEPSRMIPRIPCSMDEFEAKARTVSGVNIHKSDPRFFRGQSLCELRPLMADMFPEVLERYSWWGYGDWDVVWGDWDSFLTDELLAQYDIISSNAKTINGPWTIFRNNSATALLYNRRPDLLTSPLNGGLDESGMDSIVRRSGLRCLYPEGINAHDRHEVWNCCKLVSGKLYRMNRAGELGGEIFKFHFPAGGRWPLEY